MWEIHKDEDSLKEQSFEIFITRRVKITHDVE